MATYKVPQDVEAEDKLLGPFSFRQFVYLIVVALAIALAWGLGQIFIGLAVIPLPIILFFGTLALPLRKDQPMEIYLAAMVSFYLKPRRRLWDPEGVESLIEISAPKVVEERRTKDISQSEAQERLGYLASIVDSGGWAIRGGVGGAAASSSMNTDIFLEAQEATDVLDTTTGRAQSFDNLMTQSTERVRQDARERMLQASQATQAAPVAMPGAIPTAVAPSLPTNPTVAPQLNPYPTMQQAVIQPLPVPVAPAAPQNVYTAPATAPSTTPAPAATTPAPALNTPQGAPQTAPATSDMPPSTGIMNLANNPDLSIETIAGEARRLKKKAEQDSGEVVIRLR